MRLSDFDSWARECLNLTETERIDSSLNGIQVGQTDAEIKVMAFAVDACMDSFRAALDRKAQALFVHHGLFWGPALPLSGVLGERINFLMRHNLALYACHLPLDKHPSLGNNARIAEILELKNIQDFGRYKGCKIGFKGSLAKATKVKELVDRLFGAWEYGIHLLDFGPKEVKTVGIISGGGVREVSQAIEEDLDLYITGDSSHNIYHECREAGINVLFAGHYRSEVFGVKAMSDEVEKKLDLETFFVDIPTGY